jgi:hypothetical protein
MLWIHPLGRLQHSAPPNMTLMLWSPSHLSLKRLCQPVLDLQVRPSIGPKN